jgi:hypothetical protein
MSSIFYTVCNDKDILLEKNDLDEYRINMTIIPNPMNEFTLIDIILEHEFWNLLFELNKDIIEYFNEVKQTNNRDIISIKLKSENESTEFKNLLLNLLVTIEQISNNKMIITCVNADTKKDEIRFTDFIMNIEQIKNTNINISFKLTNANDIVNTYISLCIKKIFYRLSKYLE